MRSSHAGLPAFNKNTCVSVWPIERKSGLDGALNSQVFDSFVFTLTHPNRSNPPYQILSPSTSNALTGPDFSRITSTFTGATASYAALHPNNRARVAKKKIFLIGIF